MEGIVPEPEYRQVDASPIGFNTHNILNIIAGIYGTMHKALMEAIQNAIDSGAKKIEVEVNLSRRGDRYIYVRDNGCGCPRAEFRDKIVSIGKSNKLDHPLYDGSLGTKGIGLCAFYNKVDTYVFTSAPKAGKGGSKVWDPHAQATKKSAWEGYTEHHFHELKEDIDEPAIPAYANDRLNQERPWWNTEVAVHGFLPSVTLERGNRVILSLPALEKDIVNSFSERMRKYNSTVSIIFTDMKGKKTLKTVRPHVFTGQPIPSRTYEGKTCRRARFELRKLDTPTGIVKFQMWARSLTLPWEKVEPMAVLIGMNQDAVHALNSGYLEGIIHVDGMDYESDKDEIEVSSALYELVDFLESWVSEVGRSYLDAVFDKDKVILENVALKNALRHIRTLGDDVLADPLAFLSETVSPTGTVSPDHTELDGDKAAPRASSGDDAPSRPEEPTEQITDQKEIVPRGEQIGRIHIGAINPQGRRRRAHPSQPGFNIKYDDMLGSGLRWEFTSKGLLLINHRHNDFLDCVKPNSEQKLTEYVIAVIKLALTNISAMPEITDRGWQRIEDQMMKFVLHDILHSAGK